MTVFEIFGIVDMGDRRSDDEIETEKVAQLPFMISMKKSELKSSEMQIAPKGETRVASSVSCGRAQRLSHDTMLGRGRCPYAMPTT